MKLNHYIIGVATAALLGACSSEELVTTQKTATANNDGNVSITISLPGSEFNNPYSLLSASATRANATNYGENSLGSCSALGGITNLDMTKYDVRYIIAVYENKADDPTAATADDLTKVINPYTRTVDKYQEITESFRLLPTHTYRIVCWADFVNQGSTGDLNYSTANFPSNISVITDKDKNLNDESRDAYFKYQDVKVAYDETNDKYFIADLDGKAINSIVLKRPFAKVRLVTTDWAYGKLEMPKSFKITYPTGTKRFKGLNALTGEDVTEEATTEDIVCEATKENSGQKQYLGYSVTESNGQSSNIYYDNDKNKVPTDPDATDDDATTDHKTNNDSKRIIKDYDYDPHSATLTVDYLMTDEADETKVGFTYEAFNDAGKSIYKHKFNSDIPIKRNYITTILGNLLTVGGKFDVAINENFKNEWVDAEPWWDPTTLTPTSPIVETDASGKKTYHVYNRDQFAWLVNSSNANTAFTAGVYLEDDIDMNNIDWTPIFCGNNSGYFNGKNYALRNFNINKNRSDRGAIYKTWGVIGTFKGKIENVTFENITINGLQGSDGHDRGIGMAGAPIGMFAGELSNVHAKHFFLRSKLSYTPDQTIGGVTIYGGWTPSCVGGLVGIIYPNINGLTGKNYSLADPWKATNMCTITNCSAEDIHIMGQYAGGLIGAICYGYVIDNCSTDYVYIQSPIQSGRFIGALGDHVWLKTNNKTTNNAFFTDEDGNTALAPDGSKYEEADKSTNYHLWGYLMNGVNDWGFASNQWVSSYGENNPLLKTVQAVYTGDASTDNIKYEDE